MLRKFTRTPELPHTADVVKAHLLYSAVAHETEVEPHKPCHAQIIG